VRPLALAVLSALALTPSARGRAQQGPPDGGGSPQVTMTCERVAAPGRVRCEVEARVADGETIAWGDVALLQLPPFAVALRGRIGPHDAEVREPRLWRWPFAVVARAKGEGAVEGRVDVVLCRGATCLPSTVTLTGRLEVGP
jgi:hypothetical protein